MAPPHDPGGSSSINRDGKTFFEVLPRELRDRIYEYTFDHDVRDENYRYQFRAPHPHLRLVSRQFLREYDEQSPSDATLLIAGCNGRLTYASSESLSSPMLPPLATRCTSADMVYDVGDTDEFHVDNGNDEKYLVCSSLDERVYDFRRFIDCLQSLQRVKIQLNVNFADTFDEVYVHVKNDSDVIEYHSGKSFTSPHITVEIQHLDLSFPNLPSCLALNVPGCEILEQSETLATFQYSHGYEVMRTRFDNDIERRMHVEAAVLNAWEAEYGCTLSKSAKKAAGIVDGS